MLTRPEAGCSVQTEFSIECRRCDRLAHFLDDVKSRHPDYHSLPVPSFGATDARLLIIGLAPGMHGANRTGRPFTGDYAGILLYQTLHKFGLSSSDESISSGDGLQLLGCRITNAVKCLPPANKPDPSEIRQCNGYLATEIVDFAALGGKGLLALGRVAHQSGLMALGLKERDYPFSHGASHELPNGLTLYDSYHCSRYNTQTKRLTTEMFEGIFSRICADLALN